MSADIHLGDMLEVLPTLDADSFDSCVTDPPYHLTSGKKGGTGEASLNLNSPAGRSRITTGGGFMGKQWDGGDIAFRPETWAEVYRVLKPGAYMVAFSGSRTYHRMVCAIEDAGFVIHPMLGWVFGSGFPKATNLSKQLDKAAGAEREVVATVRVKGGGMEHVNRTNAERHGYRPDGYQKGENVLDITAPATEAARQWDGWAYGLQSLKPAIEPICFAQKPFSEKTGAANVLRHGVGAVNIDGCRVETEETLNGGAYASVGGRAQLHGDERADAAQGMFQSGKTVGLEYEQPAGRWPPNLLHDGSPEVLAAFAAFGEKTSGKPGIMQKGKNDGACYGAESRGPGTPMTGFGDTGTAARFFPALGYGEDDRVFYYSAKASKQDRVGSSHPTVKPIALMRWLCRLITPPGGRILDPFAGSGSTGVAALREGFLPTLIEREPEYHTDIKRRIAEIDGPLFAKAML